MVKSSYLIFTLSFAVLYSLLSMISCTSEDSGEGATNKSSITGKQVYQQNCVSCHGSSGDLGISGAANLKISIKTMEQRIDFIKTGSGDGKMAAYGKSNGGVLSKSEIKKVAEYIEGFISK